MRSPLLPGFLQAIGHRSRVLLGALQPPAKTKVTPEHYRAVAGLMVELLEFFPLLPRPAP